MDVVCHPVGVAIHYAWLHTAESNDSPDDGGRSGWGWGGATQVLSHVDPSGQRSRSRVAAAVDRHLRHSTRKDVADPPSGAEPTWKEFFLRRLMELTPPHLRAISARALYAKRHSASANPACRPNRPHLNLFPRVPVYHVGVIEKNVAKMKGEVMWQAGVIASPNPK